MQAWCLNSPFLIYLIIITCFCQFIKWFTIHYYHLLLAPYLFPKVSSKTNQKTEMPEVKDPFISTVSHHWKRKIQPQITKWHISKKISYTRTSHATEKARNTWLFTSNYTFYIWKQTALFDFWVSGLTLSVG